MVDTPQVALVTQWYQDFKNMDLDRVVSIFSSDAVITYGSGASEAAVDYSGHWVGTEQITQYYASRFSKGKHFREIRPFCASALVSGFGRWVIASGQVTDPPIPGGRNYQGDFIQVWSFDPVTAKVTSLDSFFDVAAKTTEAQNRPATEVANPTG